MGTAYSHTEKILFLVFFLESTIFLGFWLFQFKKQNSGIAKIIVALSLFSFMILSMWILSVFTSSQKISDGFTLLAYILAPIIWFSAATGTTLYGLVGIKRREIFISSLLSSQGYRRPNGPLKPVPVRYQKAHSLTDTDKPVHATPESERDFCEAD